MATDERSPGGSRIYRHREAPPADGVEHADDERIGAHLERTLAASESVWHELVSDRIHLDVHIVAAADDRPYITLVTSGMSARPMNVPSSVEDRASWQHAELCMVLPPDWKLDQVDDDQWFWPLRLIKTLARLPHEYDTWLGWGHSIPNGDPARPYTPGTQLAGAIIVPPEALPDDFFVVEGEPPIHIFQVVPVTALEMGFKLALGVDALIEKLEEAHPAIFGPLDPARASAV